MTALLVSADSHVVEPPEAFHGAAGTAADPPPSLEPDPDGGEWYRVPGLPRAIGLGLTASAGNGGRCRSETGTSFRELRPGAWDPDARLIDQDIDGVAAEILYPTIGLYLLGHVNRDYAVRCLRSYNHWLAAFTAHDPARLIGCAVTALRTPADAVADMEDARALGLKGLLLPVDLGTEWIDDPCRLDAVWEAAQDLELPLTFHAAPPTRRLRWPSPAARRAAAVWDAQETLTFLLTSGVFDRYPDLRVLFAEFGISWVDDHLRRLDTYVGTGDSPPAPATLPSEQARRCIGFTADASSTPPERWPPVQILWASDFPHASSTWPTSRAATTAWSHHLPIEPHEVLATSTLRLYGVPSPP